MLASKHANAHCIWICTACKNILAKARFSNAMVSADKANNAIVESLKTEIKDGILAEIRNEIRENFKQLAATQKTDQKQSSGTTNGKRQRDCTESGSGNSAKRVATHTQGVATGVTDEAAMFASSTNAESTAPLFWLYMKGFRPDVTEEKVSQWVQQKLETDVVKVRKLVPRGRDIRELSFVSFKVGIPEVLQEKALHQDTWPCEILCREFEDKSQMGFDPVVQLAPEAQKAPADPSLPEPIIAPLPEETQLKTPPATPALNTVQNMSV